MRKRLFMRVAMFLLTVAISSLTMPILGPNMERFAGASSKTTSNPESLGMNISENVTILDGGSCRLELEIFIHSSQFSKVLRNIFNFTDDIIDPKLIPPSVVFEDELTIDPEGDPDVDYTANNVTPASTSVREIFLNGIIEEHWHSLGITIRKENISVAETWGTGGECWIRIVVDTSQMHVVETGKVLIGPWDLEASFNRTGFILTKIGHIQQMLDSFDGEQIYQFDWKIEFFGDITNQGELVSGEPWYQDFGNGTFLEADLVEGTEGQVALTETMQVTEKLISVNAEELLEDKFLCYKVFYIEYGANGGTGASDPPLTQACSCIGAYFERENMSGFCGGFDPGWSMNLLDEEFTWPITNEVTLTVHPHVTFSGHVSWDFKWFKLREFKAYTKLSAIIDVNLTVNVGYEYGWDKVLIERNRRKLFMVGIYPVLVNLKFTVTAYLEIDATVGEVTFSGTADGSMKAGVGWKRKKGWYPIHEADMDVDLDLPFYDPNVEVTITPSVGFRLSLIFYETAGPFIEFEPYAAITLRPGAPAGKKWEVEVGINVNAGIEFGDWLAKILDLDDWGWPVCNFVLWRCYQCQPPEPRDVAVVAVKAPTKAFVTEPVFVYVDVLNAGDIDQDVNVTLRCEKDGEVKEYNKEIHNLTRGKTNTTEFEWDTTDLTATPENCTITAEAWGDKGEDKPEDNHLEGWVYLEVQNVRIVNVTRNTPVVSKGQSVRIDVTVENNGSVSVPALPVFAYYNETPISDIWCEHMRMVFDLPAGDSKVLTFKWDTTDVPNGNYTINATADLLPYEIHETDNTKEDDTVLVIDFPPPPPPVYIADIAITNVVPCRTGVTKGRTVDINVTVWNNGSHPETFYVKAYANTTIIQTKAIIQTKVVTLSNGTITNVTLTWNTAGREAKGGYIISAYVPPLPGETDKIDNTLEGGTVTIVMPDVAITNFVPSFRGVIIDQAYQTWTIHINVTVKNNGTLPETFDVEVYYDFIAANWLMHPCMHWLIGTQTVTDLVPGANTTLTFNWNLADAPYHNYTVKAKATLAFGAVDANPASMLVKLTGDLDGDGDVDLDDFVLFGGSYPRTTIEQPWDIIADLDGDGDVDSADFVLFGGYFGKKIYY